MFADRLNELIRKKGVTRYQVARATKVTEATLSNYVKSKGRPNQAIVKTLAAYFDVDHTWLMYGDEGSGENVTSISDSESPLYKAKRRKERSFSDISALVALFEKQLLVKDELINRLMIMLDEKVDVLLLRNRK